MFNASSFLHPELHHQHKQQESGSPLPPHPVDSADCIASDFNHQTPADGPLPFISISNLLPIHLHPAMNQHNGSRLAFSHLSSSSSPSPSSASSFAPPLTPNPNPTPSPAPSPFDQFSSLFPLKLQAQQRQALCRTINLHNSPLSPQESSTISFSDSSSFSYQRVDPHRFLKSEPCVQSQAPCKAAAFTTPNNKARVFTNIIINNKNIKTPSSYGRVLFGF